MRSSFIALIHFHPLELFPPVMNDINYFENSVGEKLYVYTTKPSKKFDKFKVHSTKIKIMRFGSFNLNNNIIIRYINYFLFYFQTIVHLLYRRHKTILYFETLSSFPVYVYKIIFKAHCRVFIHYHEYTSKQEYKSGMKLNNWFHNMEKSLYPSANWISHTNPERMSRFITDIKPIKPLHTYILPNYPPKDWYAGDKHLINVPLKIVYVGALSMETMYTEEFAKWVINQKGKVLWDIYPWNITEDVKVFMESLNTNFIKLKSTVNYTSLKAILRKYDIGIILYKGHSPNYVLNAPNKLFEYHACDLDVWFPNTIVSSLSYITIYTYPKIIALDFMNLNNFNYLETIERRGLEYKQNNLFCENAVSPLREKLLDNK